MNQEFEFVSADSSPSTTIQTRTRGKKTTALGLQRASDDAAPTPCSGGCKDSDCSRQGTNATHNVRRCRVCGWREVTPKDTPIPRCDPNVCQHLNTDNRGSTKDVKKIYCKDCCQTIRVFPRAEHIERRAIGDTVAIAPAAALPPVQRLVARSTDAVTVDHCRRIADLFQRNIQRTVAALSDLHENRQHTTVSQIISALEDVIDRVLDYRDLEPAPDVFLSGAPAASSAPAAPTPTLVPTNAFAGEYTVFMNTQTEHRRSLKAMAAELRQIKLLEAELESVDTISGSDPELDNPRRGPHCVSQVDTETDPRIWIALDEGCNSACHSQSWAQNAEAKYLASGMRMPWVSKEQRFFQGVGTLSSVGTRRIAGCLGLVRRDKRKHPDDIPCLHLPTMFDSHQWSEAHSKFTPPLLSSDMQAQLGFIKHMDRGYIQLRDYPDCLLYTSPSPRD